jgi:hypothetical protein
MVIVGGFIEVKNMENMYYNPLRRVAVSIHVDDPFIVAKDEEGHEWTHKFMNENFDTKGENRLTVGKEIDYCSMEINLLPNGDITLTNAAKIDKFLEDAGKTDIIPTKQPPMTKGSLKAALTQDTPLTDEENTARLGDNGRFGWLAQTTHVGLVVATSIAQGLPAIEGTKAVSEQMYQWIKAHRRDGLISKSGVHTGLYSSGDADWGGMHSITGETRSRTAEYHEYNGMCIDAHSSLQKTISSKYCGPEEPLLVATSSGNAETISAGATLSRAMHLSYLAEELGLPIERPLKIGIDANAAMGFLQNTGGGGRMKHLDIRLDWIQQARDRSIAEFVKESTDEINADFFSKLHDRVDFNKKYARIAYIPDDIDNLQGQGSDQA